MLECRRIRLLWGLSEIFKRVIKIFWGEVFMVRNTMKTGQPFLVTISEAFSRRSDCGYSAKRCEQKKKNKKTRGWGGRGEVCERGNWKFPTLSVSLFSSFFFFSLSSFAPHSTIETPGTNYNFGRDASAPPPHVETLLFDWFWSWLTKACLHAQNMSYIAARCKRPDIVCPPEIKETIGRGKRPQRAT